MQDKLEQELDKELSKKMDKIFETDAEKFFNIFKFVYEKQELLEDIPLQEIGYHFNQAMTVYQFGVKKLKLKWNDKEYAKVLLKRFNTSYKIYKLIYN